MKKENLVKAAENLNKVLFEEDDPQMINVKAEAGPLKSEIREAAVILEPSDELEENTVKVLSELLEQEDLKKGAVANLKKLGVWDDDKEGDGRGSSDEETEAGEKEKDEETSTSLEDQITNAKTTKECIEIAKSDDCFTDLKGEKFKTMKLMKEAMVEALSKKADDNDDDKKEDPPAKEKAKKEKKEKKTTAKKEKKGLGVIATIASSIADAGQKGVSKKDLLEILVEAFPERDPKAMKNTISVQVPGRISRERFELEETKNGKFRKV